MEEDNGVKAPVTRLRRRLSVEQSEDVKSPAPATPTKKRGGRLAAKPQLGLIEENAPTPGSATKRSTRKTSVKDIADVDEKPVTPSRRSTRIKSNTSIVSETTQSYDSPRAKRATRRTSQVGSDSESSVTPARATRRTRKDSASSIEKLEVTLASKPSNIKDVIIEETESSSVKSDDTTKANEIATEITPIRRSPRLKGKKQMDSKIRKSIEKSNDDNKQFNSSSSKEAKEKQNEKSQSIIDEPQGLENENLNSEKSKECNSSFLMIKELDKNPRNNSSGMNKSTSAIDSNCLKSKRQRTKSWTITSHSEVDEGMFYSDNENVKKRFQKQVLKERKKTSKHMGSGDHTFINSEDQKSINQSTEEESINNTSVHKNTQNASLFSTTKARISKWMSTPSPSPQGNKENIQTVEVADELHETTKLFEKAPGAILQSTVLFEDSDTDSKGKVAQLNIEDQCVPEVDNELVQKQVTKSLENDIHATNFSALNKTNDNNMVDDVCEPMDIDETIPNNISLLECSQKSLNQTSDDPEPQVQNQSVTSTPQMDSSLNESTNKSRRKSSLTFSNNQSLEKTENENKSTLIISHIKDVSSTEQNTSISPKASNELLSKSDCTSNLVKKKVLDNKNVSQDYSTSTPLQQKKFQKLGMEINSSIIDTSISGNKQAQNKSKNEISQTSKSSEGTSESESEDEVDSSRPRNSLLDNEAEVASDNYESGDSRDEEEREYEKNNQIIEGGETLDSDDEVSNDTDYEKDSFVVSSDEQDNELLSGSGDDLSMSDNELTMSKKSKTKYNERKMKDQKKASREMYEARHKLDTSDASVKFRKSKRQKIETSEESEEEETIAPVKRNKLRLDSTQENESLNKSNANNSKLIKKSKRKRLSESVCDENANIEHEITVYGDDGQNDDPLSVQVKVEPKTPMKDMDISTVQINDNIEEVCVENNQSVMKSNDTVDPLQATMLEEESSMSENSEIINNYDSVLKNLNSDKPIKIKTLDTSLNRAKKTKQNKQPIIDQLNITDTKRHKKKSIGNDVVDSTQPNQSTKKGNAPANDLEDSSSSEFIDLQLLFSEESQDFDTSQNKEVHDTGEAEDFIPLKRTPGKMNILNTEDNTDPAQNKPLNERVKNKRRSSKGLLEEQPVDFAVNNNDIQIIIDTQGARRSSDKSLNTSQNTSTKKKKNKKNVSLNDEESMLNESTKTNQLTAIEGSHESTKFKKKKMSIDTHIEDEPAQDMSIKYEDAPEEIIITKSKKKNKKSSETFVVNVSEVTNLADDDAPEEIPFTSNKNRKSSETLLAETTSKEELPEKSMNDSLNVNSAKKKKKKHSEKVNESAAEEDIAETSNTSVRLDSTKKKKKKLSVTLEIDDSRACESKEESHIISTGSTKNEKRNVKSNDEPKSVGESSKNSKKRKRESSSNQDDDYSEGKIPQMSGSAFSDNHKKKRKISQNEDLVQLSDPEPKKKNKKRKERDDDDDGNEMSKIFKENTYGKVSVTRLPTSIINQLNDKPEKDVLEMKKSLVVSTTPFIVEDTRKRRNKPSAFLEESVYLNDTHVEKKKKVNIKKPKVLPFIPTAETSVNGFTTRFRIDVIPQEVKFVAQTKSAANFKNDYLYGKRIRRLGTYETYKKHRSAKMSKF